MPLVSRLSLLSVAASLVLSGCGGDECEGGVCTDASIADADVDSGVVDASTDAGGDLGVDASTRDFGPRPDVGPTDVGTFLNTASCVNAGAPNTRCAPGCPGDGLCLTTQTESYCIDPCNDDRSGCLDGYNCIDVGATAPFFACLPPAFSCLTPGTSMGTSCAGGAVTCQADRETCQGDLYGAGYCTDRCDDGLCPAGFSCGPGDDGMPTCRAEFAAPAERCATETRADEMPCIYDGDCVLSPSSVCVTAGPGLPGVCATPCENDACIDGQVCRPLEDGRRVCLPERCACRGDFARAGSDLLGDALDAIGLDRCRLTVPANSWVVVPPDVLADPYRLSFMNPLTSESWRVPEFSNQLVAELERHDSEATNAAFATASMIESMSARLDHPAVRSAPGMLDPTEPLVRAVADLIRAVGGFPDLAAIRTDAMDVPMDLQLALATVVDGIHRAVLANQTAFGQLNATVRDQLFTTGHGYLAATVSGLAPDPADPSVMQVFNELIDYGSLFGGGADLMAAIGEADLARFETNTGTTGPVNLLFSQDTPIGRIAVGDGSSNVYDPRDPNLRGAYALLVDLGGDDEYMVAAGGTQSIDNMVSVLIDLGGDDDYGYLPVPSPNDGARLPSDGRGRATDAQPELLPFSLSDTSRQGAGRVGIGVHVDLGAGTDRYRSLRLSQGAGIFGVGVLLDEGGPDVYEAEAVAQGAGMFGLGLVYDAGGRDVRTAYQASQGFGFARGAGLLYDAEGNDDYTLDVGDPAFGGDVLYPSAQRAENNASLGQGFAFGRRGDLGQDPDRAFMSGGLGVLLDEAGDDTYLGGIFAQGGGFWWGTGILADRTGNDQYDSFWYGMGSGAHYAVGVLMDGAGDDLYGSNIPGINVTIAGGHDFSTVFVIDESGNDTYLGSRITLGAGNSNGRGVFVDNAGQDTYTTNSAYSIGSAGLLDPNENFLGSARRRVPSIGLFVDASGVDSYMQAGQAPMGIDNDSAWLQTNAATVAVAASELGSGIDAEGDSTVHTPW